MSDVVRLVDTETQVEVLADKGDNETIRVKLGPEPHSVTFVGTLSDLHRLFVEVDRQISGLVARSHPG